MKRDAARTPRMRRIGQHERIDDMDIFRIFKKTTERTSHVGQAGYDTPENRERFFAKYMDSCVVFLETKYPQWKADAEDVFMMAVEEGEGIGKVDALPVGERATGGPVS